MYYKVKLNDPITNYEHSTTEGYLRDWIDATQPALYTRGEAIKKANMFGGKIEKLLTYREIVNTTIVEMTGNDLLEAIKELLKHRELFKSNDVETKNTLIYKGDIFAILKAELIKLETENNDFKTKTEILEQLNELSQMITSEYVLINDMCFS